MICFIDGDPSSHRSYLTTSQVGNLGMLDAVCSTWFGTNPLYVHMINFLPVTSATGELFNKSYTVVEDTEVLDLMQEVDLAWRGYVVANQAISDPNAAWSRATGLNSGVLDTAISKTELLYWIATRSGFDATQPPPDDAETDDAPDQNQTSSCSSRSACVHAGLVGLCCPTATGIFLNCCT